MVKLTIKKFHIPKGKTEEIIYAGEFEGLPGQVPDDEANVVFATDSASAYRELLRRIDDQTQLDNLIIGTNT